MVGWISADNTDSVQFGDVLGNGHELRHGLERLSEIVLVQASDNDPFTGLSQFTTHMDQVITKELGLIDTDYIRVLCQEDDLGSGGHGC